jgi:multidrug efflux pump subunit AcrB
MSESPAVRSDLSTLFFRNRHLLWLSVLAILVGGVWAGLSLPQLEDPRIANRNPIVITPVPGAPAERVDALVTKVIEDALNEIDEIKDLESTSRAGVSVIAIELAASVTAHTNQQLFAEIRDKLGEARSLLPPEAGEPLIDDKRDPAAFTLILGVAWDRDDEPALGILGRVAKDLADRLRTVEGTELVRVFGASDEEIIVRVEPDELAELGLSPAGLAAAVAGADAKLPGGVLRSATSDVLIEVEGELETLDRVRNVTIATGDQDSVLTVGDIATISREWRTPEDEIALVDGRRSVLVAARVASGLRVDRWADAVDAKLVELEAWTAPGIRIERVFEQQPYTAERIGVLMANLLAGAAVILAAAFLIMGLRPAIVIALALPLVVATVALGWQVTGGAIHQMSIFGLIIALGLLIDNAIVVTDEITAAKARGLSPLDAVRSGVRHLAVPLLASTITTVLAFAPIMLLEGGAGDFVRAIGTSVILAIVASLGIALTITAAFAGMFAKPTLPGVPRRWWRDGVAPAWLAGSTRFSLRKLLAVPLVPIGIAAAAPALGFVIAPTLGSQFFPAVDRHMFEVRVWMPTDSSIAATASKAREIEADLRALGGVEHVSWLMGGSYPTVYYNLVMNQDRSPHYAQAVVTTTSSERTKALLDEAQGSLDRLHPEAQVVVRQLAQGPPVAADIEYRILGPSPDVLRDLGDLYREALQEHPHVIHTQVTMPRGAPKLMFEADESEARLGGVSLATLASQLESTVDGAVGGSVIEDLERLPVRVRYPDERRGDLASITSTAFVDEGSDRWLSAAALGEFTLRPELAGISRFDGERTNTVKAYVRNGSLPLDVSAEVLAALEARGFTLPEGYRIGVGGAQEQDGEATSNLATYAPLLALLMVSTLVLAFRSVTYAAMLGCVAIFSLGLALLSTWSIGFPVSFNTILGTLGLIGVALNDSIVVLAAIRADPRAAAGDREAIVEATMGCTRHVLATTATTIGGFLPLLLFVGGDFWPSLAIVLVGGIAGSTLVALLFIPAAHILATDLKQRVHHTSPTSQPEAALA